jgi:hypothetical protein
MVLETNENDLPVLPNELPTKCGDQEAVIRQFCTGYYCELILPCNYETG